MSNSLPVSATKPWYREPWPWYLMAGPGIVVIAAFFTLWLAISTSDGLVTDDYYKKGLAVGQTIAESDRAASLGLEVRARFTADGVVLSLTSAADEQEAYRPPQTLTLTLSHPTRAGLDQSVTLVQEQGRYTGRVRLPTSGHWLVLVEDDAKTWRLMGNVVLPASGETVIGGGTTAKRS
ncbi:MAG TPA: FixH family protein [Rhodocyclaceae bacterium]|nr:FixH family protein [Rhodocyclaceae bacterium]